MNEIEEKEYDIEIDPNAGLHRVYDYLPYTHWHIKQILNDYYNAHLVCIRAYKEGRYAGYKQRYNIYDNDSGSLIRKNVRLDELRRLFAHKEFPLQEDNGRNPNARQFIEYVNAIAEMQSKENN